MGSLKKFKDSISYAKQVGLLNKKELSTSSGGQTSKTNLTKALDKFVSDPGLKKLPKQNLDSLGQALDKLKKKKVINELPDETIKY